MISSEFIEIFKQYPNLLKFFDGVYASNTLPQKPIKVNHFLICNTDLSTGPGKHWFCIVRTSKDTLECFDSLGIDQEKKTFLFHHYRNSQVIKEIKINVDGVQSLNSDTCGQFVVFFIFERLHNRDLSFDDLFNECFSSDIEANEQIIKTFFSEMFENVRY